MADRQKRVCVPLETEMLPLYRDAPGVARLRREEKRRQRREKGPWPKRVRRRLARLTA